MPIDVVVESDETRLQSLTEVHTILLLRPLDALVAQIDLREYGKSTVAENTHFDIVERVGRVVFGQNGKE